MNPDYYRPDHFKFGGGADHTVLHPIVLAAMLLAIVLMLALPRKYVVIPFLGVVFLSPQGQEIFLGGMHIFVMRILILTGCARMLWNRYSRRAAILPGGFSSLDRAFLLWAIFRALTFILMYLDPAALVNRVGFLWDALGGYFLLRYLIRDQKDVHRVLKCFAVLAMLLGACMIHERLTRHNIFGELGGVRPVSEVRDGQVRAQAIFAHPLLAGSFGATMFPLLILVWKYAKAKALAFGGMVGCLAMVITSSTSTSILAWGAGIFGLCCWPLRRRMRVVRWAIVIGLISLHLIMRAPVWFVISHIDLTGSSSSYHRAELLDHFIRNFGDWWLAGTRSNADWGANMWDTINQFVQEGEDGGLPTLIPFVAMIVIAFGWIGTARRVASGNRSREFYYWILGSALFAHVIGFFGVSYFDQTRVSWYALLVIISAAALPHLKPAAATENSAVAPGTVLDAAAY